MAEQDTLVLLAEEIATVFEPLQEGLNSPEDFVQFMRELGWDFSSIAGPINAIKPAVVALIDLLSSGDFNTENIGQLTNKIGTVINEVKDFGGISNGALPSTVDKDEFKNEFPEQLIQTLTVDYLLEQRGQIGKILQLIGIIRVEEIEVSGKRLAYTKKEISWSDIGNFFNDPTAIFANAYKWGTADFRHDYFFDNLFELGNNFGWEMRQEHLHPNMEEYLKESADDPDDESGVALKLILWEDNAEPLVSKIGLGMQTLPKAGAEMPGFAILPFAKSALEEEIELSEEVKLLLSLGFDVSAGLAMMVRPSGIKIETGIITDSPQLPPSGLRFSAGIQYEKAGGEPTIILGAPESSRLEFKSFGAKVGGAIISNAQQEIFVETELKGGKLVIKLGGADGFLQSVMPEGGIEGSFDLTIGWSSVNGVYFKGGGGLEIELPTHITLGPVELNGLQIGINPSSDGIPINLSASITANLGPFVAVIERMGITANFDFAENDSGNLGPIDFGMGFKPPNGIGLSLDTGVVKGGGYLYFDFEKEEYAGALELAIQDTLVVTAIGVVTTEMPDGSKGFSLLLMISVQFSPGIALGFGFFLTGLGGLIGLNRTVNVEALRLGVKSGTLDNILFPEDVVQNISKIISDIREIFPPKQDQFILGLMAHITWGVPKLITVEFGILVEFASPVRIAILGVLKCVLPTEDQDLIRIQVNFLGIIDFDNKYLSFDASIFNSKILTFTLEGDMALRINWGDKPGFLMSVGGFHPSFKPEASLGVSNMKRLTLNLLSGNPRLTLTTYFAITSNTVQFGASIDFLFKVSKFKVIGYFGFDVLFQFSPFKFIANIRAGIEIKLGSTTLFAINLEFELQGPTPWIARGTASFKILFFTIKVKFKKTFGEKKDSTLPAVAVMPKVLEALNAQQNWISVIPNNRYALVSMREDGELEGEIVLNPFGSLTVSQNVLPLGLDISKYGNFKPQDLSKLRVTEARIGDLSVPFGSVKDNFAPANFKEMADNDKLKSPSFVKEDSGIKLTGTEELHMNYHINRPVQYEVITSDHEPESATPFTFIRFDELLGANMDAFKLSAKGGVIAHSALSQENKLKQSIKMSEPISLVADEFKVVSSVDLTQIAGIDFSGGSKAQATDALRSFIKANPKMKDKVQMVPSYQL